MLAASRIPADASLPQLASVLDEEAMALRFAAHLAPDWSLKRCRVQEVRYYPDASCLLMYVLKLDHGAERTVLSIAARAFGHESVPAAFASRAGIATDAGLLPAWLPDLRLALWAFPDDPALPGLAEVWRRGGELFDGRVRLDHVPWRDSRPRLETAMVSYVPAKRCILRYDRLDHARPEPFYGKIYSADDARTVHARGRALWEYAQRDAPELGLARPLGCDPGVNAVWQDAPGGESLLDALDETSAGPTFRRVAAALAALHRAPLGADRRWRVADETVKLERTRAALLRFHPELRREIEATIAPLVAMRPVDVERPVPVHGDFHCNQVLVGDERVAILDFDLYGHGDPLHDIARFLSRFEVFAHGTFEPDIVRSAQEAFLSTYSILVPQAVDRGRLAWWKATLLVNRQALKPVKKLSAAGSEPVATVLAAARAAAEGRDFT